MEQKFEQDYMKFLESTIKSSLDRRIPILDCINTLKFQTQQLMKAHGDIPIFQTLNLIINKADKCYKERISQKNCYDYLIQFVQFLTTRLEAVEGDEVEETGMRLPYDTSGRFVVQRKEPEEVFRPLLEDDANKLLDFYEDRERIRLQSLLYKDLEEKDAARFFRDTEARDAYLLRNRIRIEDFLRKQRVKYHGLGNISNFFKLGEVEFSFKTSKKGKTLKKEKTLKKGKH